MSKRPTLKINLENIPRTSSGSDNGIRYIPIKSPSDIEKIHAECLKKKNYKLDNVLGNGAFGQTFKLCAELETSKNCKYVMKIQSASAKTQGEPKTKSQNEIDILLKLKNENIGPKIIEHFECNNKSFIVMELWDGLINFGDLSPSEQELAIKDIIDKLKKIHSINISHNDVKLENMLFRKVGENVMSGLIDWGESLEFETGKSMQEKILAYQMDFINLQRSLEKYTSGSVLETLTKIIKDSEPKIGGRKKTIPQKKKTIKKKSNTS